MPYVFFDISFRCSLQILIISGFYYYFHKVLQFNFVFLPLTQVLFKSVLVNFHVEGHICFLFHICLVKSILIQVIISLINLLIKQNLSEWRDFPSLHYLLRSTCSVSTSSFHSYFKRRNVPISLNYAFF